MKPKMQKSPDRIITAGEVEEYLYRHPDFFQDRDELLEVLRIPHPCGEAVSLVTRQIELLRDKNRRLQQQMQGILQVARDNDTLHQRIQQLTLALLDTKWVEDTLASLEWGLDQYFQADFVAVRIAEPYFESPIADLRMASGNGLELFESVLESGRPECGRPAPDQAAFLFGLNAGEVQSCALVPLLHAGLRGLLAIGSRNPNRFQSGMGLLFLTQLGEILSARLAVLLNNQG